MLFVPQPAIAPFPLLPGRSDARASDGSGPTTGLHRIRRSGSVKRSRQRPGTEMRPRVWTINGRFLSQPITGVQRYAREIVSALDQLVEDDPLALNLHLVLVVPSGADVPPYRSISVRRVTGMTGHLWE